MPKTVNTVLCAFFKQPDIFINHHIQKKRCPVLISPMTAFCLNYLKIAHYLNASVFLSIIWLRVNQFTLQLYITSFTTLIGCPFSSGITYVCCPSRDNFFTVIFLLSIIPLRLFLLASDIRHSRYSLN